MLSILNSIDNLIVDKTNSDAFDEAIIALQGIERIQEFFGNWTGPIIKAVSTGVVLSNPDTEPHDKNYNGEDVSGKMPEYAYLNYNSSVGMVHHSVYQAGSNTFDIISVKINGPILNANFSGGPLELSEMRVVFHELAHGVTLRGESGVVWRDAVGDGREFHYSEELAVFAENVYLAITPNQYRLGHFEYPEYGSVPYGGIVGVEMFKPFSGKPIFSGDDHSVKFTSTDSSGSITASKTFFKPGQGHLDELSHVIIDRIDFSAALPLVTASGNVSVLNVGASGGGASYVTSFIDGLMKFESTGSIVATINNALATKTSMAALASKTGVTGLVATAYDHSFSVLSGFSGQRFIDDDDDKAMDVAGPVAKGTLTAASVLEQTADAQSGTILIGGAGFKGVDWIDFDAVTPEAHDFRGSADKLIGGGKSDILVAGGGLGGTLDGASGDDILIGGNGIDRLKGGSGSDILIGSLGSDFLDGGSNDDQGGDNAAQIDIAYYGNIPGGVVYTNGAVVKVFDQSVDHLTNIETVVGTSSGDIFLGEGKGMTFVGETKASTNSASDTYYASDGPDKFVDFVSPGGLGNTLDFSNVTTSVDLEMPLGEIAGAGTTKAGHTFTGISNIVGSDGRDKFDIAAQNVVTTVHGGDEDDEFIMAGRVDAYGDDGNDVFKMAGNYQRAFGGIGSDRFYITQNASSISIDGGSGPGDVDVLDFSLYPGEARINLATSTFSGGWAVNSFTGIERFEYGKNAMRIDGSSAGEQMWTGSTKSTLNAGGGNDWLWVTAADQFTPVGYKAEDVLLDGGSGSDHLFAYRAATLNGGADDDFIFGSSERDIIRGGSGNDVIDAGGGDDVFDEAPNGIDHIDAGAGDADVYRSVERIGTFDFFLSGDNLEWFGVQKTGVATNQLLFQNLDKLEFNYASDKIDVSRAIAMLQADEDHFMTGTQLKAALAASASHRGVSDQVYEDPGFSFAPEPDPSEAEYMSAAFTPDHDVRYDTYDTDPNAWAMQTGVYQAPMHSDWFFV